MKKVYLDYNATTPTHPEALRAMENAPFGNPSSLHWAGRESAYAIDQAREEVADLLEVQPREIIFTSGGSEAINLAIRGIFETSRQKGKDHIVTTAVEHEASLETCRYLEKQGARVTYLPVNSEGEVNLNELESAITEQTCLINVMWVNNETGNIFPVEKIGEIAKRRGILFHSDAVQGVGKISVKPKQANVPLISLSGHKLYGPKGVGALYVQHGIKMERLIHGGGQERYRRAGTENVSHIIGLGKACKIARGEMEKEAKRLRELRDQLYHGLMERIPEIHLNTHFESAVPSTLNVSILYVQGESLLLNLDAQGIAVSSGSACSSGRLEPSHVLQAMGRNYEEAHSALRFSLGRNTTPEEVNYALEVLPKVIERLRSMSAVYQ
jgi:cysteine desulfurase